MKTYIDLRKVKRRALISNLASVGGLMLLLGGVIVPLFLPALHQEAQVLMVIGIGVAMVGIYLANRWIRRPRPEDSLDQALKSLNDSYHLYHYPSLPCDHVLLTPGNVVVIEVFNLAGEFSYKEGRWKEKMGLGRALRYIVEERLGNPIKNCLELEQYLQSRFAQYLGSGQTIPVSSIVVFTHPAVRLEVHGAPIPVCKVDKLRSHIPTKVTRLDSTLYGQISLFMGGLTTG